ncbi:MAG: hypothetical protein ACJAST_003873, partial [Halopseudomonas sp.]
MSEVITFKPKVNVDAERQVEAYIAFAKKLRGFDKVD